MAAVPALAVAGYVVFSDPRMGLAITGAAALAVWGLFCLQRPYLMLPSLVPLLLLAGTKFRMRDATDSLSGSLDAQILFELATFATIGVGAVAVLIGCRTGTAIRKIELLMAAYVALALASSLWSEAPAMTLVRGVQLAIICLLAAATVRVLGPTAALRLPAFAAGVYVMCCAALAAIFPWAAAVYESREDRYRFAWFAVHPIEAGTVAGIAALGLIAAMWWRHVDDRRSQAGWLHYAAALCAVAVLVLTNSRGPLLAFAAGMATLAYFRLPARLQPATILFGLAPLLLLLAAGSDLVDWMIPLTARDGALAQFLLQGQTADDLLGMNGRMELWDAVRPELAQHGLLGYGYQASRAVLLDAAYWTPAYAHNALLQSLLDLGAAGTIPLFAIVAVAVSAVVRRGLDPGVRSAAAAIAVFLVLNSIVTESYAGAPGFDAFMLCVCALCAASPRRARLPGEPS